MSRDKVSHNEENLHEVDLNTVSPMADLGGFIRNKIKFRLEKKSRKAKLDTYRDSYYRWGKIGKIGDHDIVKKRPSKGMAYESDDAEIAAINRKTGEIDMWSAGHIKKNKNGTYSYEESYVTGRPGSKIKLHQLYNYFIKHHNWIIVSDASHSPGAAKAWDRLAKVRGVGVHGWKIGELDSPIHDKKGKPVNIDPHDDEDKYSHEVRMDPTKVSAGLRRPGWGDDYEVEDDSNYNDVRSMRLVAFNKTSKPVKRTKKVMRKKIAEDAPVNNVGGGAIAGMGIGPDGEPGVSKKVQKKHNKKKSVLLFPKMIRRTIKEDCETFAGAAVFEVDSHTFHTIKLEKRKHKHWRKYLGEDDAVAQIREYANKNHGRPIIIRNKLTSEMMYVRYGKR